jgi:hypothetical protein
MSAALSSRRKKILLLAAVFLTAVSCNMPGLVPQAEELFPTPSPIPFEALLIDLTHTPPTTITPGGAAEVFETPTGSQLTQTQPVPVIGASSTPPPTITVSGSQGRCLSPAVTAGQGQAVVYVYFHCDGRLAPAPRLVPQGPTDALAYAAMQALLAGPTRAEGTAGYTSWFSSQTAGTLRSLTSSPAGQVTVDLADFSSVIPNASTSAGSQILVDQISATLFQFSEYQSILMMFEGDCSRFWNWLQSSCSLVSRSP